MPQLSSYNPYGAVPAALKETRLSLKDIMDGYLTGKKLEQDMSLALTKADVEKTLAQSAIEKEQLHNRREMATLEAQEQHRRAIEQHAQDQLAQQYDIHQESLAQRRKEHEQQQALSLRQLAIQEAANRTVPLKNLLRFNDPEISNRFFRTTGLNPDLPVRQNQALELYTNFKDPLLLAQKEGNLFSIARYDRILADPKSTEAQRQQALTGYRTALDTVAAIDSERSTGMDRALMGIAAKTIEKNGGEKDDVVSLYQALRNAQANVDKRLGDYRTKYEQYAAGGGRTAADQLFPRIESQLKSLSEYDLTEPQKAIIRKMTSNVTPANAPFKTQAIENILRTAPKKKKEAGTEKEYLESIY